MSDFQQSRSITTLHRLGNNRLEAHEAELEQWVGRRKVALILPCTHTDLEKEAIPRIVSHLEQVGYLDLVVVSIEALDLEQFRRAREVFSRLPQTVRILWHNGPRMHALVEELEQNQFAAGEKGKGSGSWLASGYLVAHGGCKIIASHDADILTYDRALLARLCYPVVNGDMGYEFCKGYYARYREQLFGRVTRLFVSPLLRSLNSLLKGHPVLDYLDSFRYPLAGEFAVTVDLLKEIRIPLNWAVEIGMLLEAYRNVSPSRICQVDLIEHYDHIHRPLSPHDPDKGLMKMSIDIADHILRTLAAEGVQMGWSFFRTLATIYERSAEEMVKRYHDDARINQLSFDSLRELRAVETFRRALQAAMQGFLDDPHGVILTPNWNRVGAVIPGFLSRLHQAVEEDNES